MYALARSVLFCLEAETAHHVALKGLRTLERTPLRAVFAQDIPSDPVELWGLKFPHRVGLAAGLDKNGDYLDALAMLGFAFIELGTVTPRPQPGNPRPRMFRLPKATGIINRLGFNNQGVDYLLEKISKSRYQGVLGINIGKNFDTPVEKANDDYLICLRKVYPYAHYITVNISSPNTQGLRSLQFGEALDSLLGTLKAEQAVLQQKHGKYVPLLLKIAPDLSHEEVIQVADALRRHQFDGAIATNTTVGRIGVEGLEHAQETGGLSGAPVFAKSTEVLGWLATELKGQMPIIGVGGITKGEDAAAKIRAGASLVQVYSGFIYRGPALIREAAIATAKSL
ncbi:quinone-dependent dihydroorotate dehydrogenase [Permianibacter sp. IMCC34836]|uniref:quinone-dependent dihydroorotate dehydrogenase n=1 Tax=Permianibacter fluminis TaxID=2738515 RepID=UPI001554E75E|nr:quinone-dependent dihydroorotate dehydrogenase [Permianibacter fluminis]NQD38781.1 quinone-dependent dihydroorotate dehydrogenase [Permianibacter fluminis]